MGIETALILGGAAVAGGVATTVAADKAAGAQKDAANQANSTQLAMYNQNRADLAGFRNSGNAAGATLNKLMGLGDGAASGSMTDGLGNSYVQNPDGTYTAHTPHGTIQVSADQFNSAMTNYPATGAGAADPTNSLLLKPFGATEADLAATPGYQFARAQGLKAVTNANSARGMGLSGAQLKGAASFATGLADETYGNQFSRYMQTQDATYNRLMGVTQLGENAAAQTGAFGTQTASSVGNNLVGAGNANAAATMAGANAFSGGANNAATLFALRNGFGGGGNGIFTSNSTQG